MNKDDALRQVRCFLLDMDGTFYLGEQLLEGALEFIDVLHQQGCDYLFLTNNSSKNSQQYVEKITRLAVSAAQSSTAAQAAQMDIKAHMRRMCTETSPETRPLSPYRRYGTGMSVLLSTAGIPRPICDVRNPSVHSIR